MSALLDELVGDLSYLGFVTKIIVIFFSTPSVMIYNITKTIVKGDLENSEKEVCMLPIEL